MQGSWLDLLKLQPVSAYVFTCTGVYNYSVFILFSAVASRYLRDLKPSEREFRGPYIFNMVLL